MATSGVTGTDSTGRTSLTQAIAGNQKLGQEDFLKLLVTQLTNQDPLSPQDDKAFIGQMAQFSTLESVNSLDTSMNRLQGAALIGRTVDAQITENGTSNIITGVVKSVTFRSDGVHFLVNDKDVSLDQLKQVRE